MNTQTALVRIDESTIARGDVWEVIQPVWWTATIYDGPAEYKKSLRPFTRQQRLIFAILWYREEVNNGGHEQFYSNSTGIVWRDALEGLEQVGLPQFATILRESATRLGGEPPLDRGERQRLLRSLSPDFADLDDKFYELDQTVDLEGKLTAYVRSRSKDFYFTGHVTKSVLPQLK